MELQLQPRSNLCCATGVEFQPGDRVISVLARGENEFRRFDCLASAEKDLQITGEELCRWTRTFKPAAREANPERELKLTAETLFLSLTEEGNAVEENADLKQFLALMLERKRVLKSRGRSPAGHLQFLHPASNRMIEVPTGEMDAEFFVAVREKLGVLLGEPSPSAPSQAPGAPSPESEPEPEQ
ncbi:MAG: hypothetical protein ACREIA_04200 [Opitutaceae bacterium]